MATSHERRKLARQAAEQVSTQNEQQQEELVNLEEDQEISPELATRIATQMGNDALRAIIRRPGDQGAEVEGVDLEIEVEEEAQEHEEAEDRSVDEEVGGHEVSMHTAGSSGMSGYGREPWKASHLFGGDDDDDDDESPLPAVQQSIIRRGRGMLPRFGPDEDEAVQHIDALANVIKTTPPLDDEERWGDCVYRAVESGLEDVAAMAMCTFEPEDMVDQTGPWDPVGRPGAIGRFLCEHATDALARSVSRVLATSTSVLMPPDEHLSGAVARMAALSICAEAHEGGGVRTDRAVALALCMDAWPDAVEAAEEAARAGGLHAAAIAEAVLKYPPHRGDLGEPSALGGRALQSLVPPGFVPDVPRINLVPPRPEVDDDPGVAAIDAMLATLTGGPDPLAKEHDPLVAYAQVQPVLDVAEDLVTAMGRTQVELAAAAVAISRVMPDAPTLQVLLDADLVLRRMARKVIAQGERLSNTLGLPVSEVGDVPAQVEDALLLSRRALIELRRRSLETLAGAVSP